MLDNWLTEFHSVEEESRPGSLPWMFEIMLEKLAMAARAMLSARKEGSYDQEQQHAQQAQQFFFLTLREHGGGISSR
jgi:hypothetical protein